MTNPRRQRGAHPTDFIGEPLPAVEALMWASLSPAQRAKAIQRMTALDRWDEASGETELAKAAADAGVKSVTRFYEMRKAWRAKRSLASLGAFAGAPKTRVGRHDAAIRRALPTVVAADPGGSVRKLALDLAASIGIPTDGPPSHNTLRRYVEEEKRRLLQRTLPGDDLRLDCSACTLTPSEADVVTVFVIIDRWTQIVLGAALGDVADSRAGYAAAARDAGRRIRGGRFASLPWVERMSSAEVVVGTDLGRWTDIRDEAAAAGLRRPINASTRPNRFGSYLRDLTGLRVGSVTMLPKRTVDTASSTPPSASSQVERLAVEVDEHNADRIAALGHCRARPVTTDVEALLRFLSGVASPSR